jgi:hypothetical protein
MISPFIQAAPAPNGLFNMPFAPMAPSPPDLASRVINHFQTSEPVLELLKSGGSTWNFT